MTHATPSSLESRATANVVSVRDNLIRLHAKEGHIMKNEVAYVCVGDQRLKAEVLRVMGRTADIQVFEDTRGVRIGDQVELTGELLSVALGPGLLGRVYDGLQNPLNILAGEHGFFLPRGHYVTALDTAHKWSFQAGARTGDMLQAGDVIGTVQEGRFAHKIMIPFDQSGVVEVTWIQSGNFTVNETVARIKNAKGNEQALTMTRRWPVRRPVPEQLLNKRLAERLYPNEPLITTTRIIDTFFPIAQGGTACIPGPFGAGKTVLQSLISRYSSADIVIVVACGERAGEVVETITEFPQMKDPRTGGSLMDRTIIICNTSSMPVAAREASIYTGITLGEYYRQMGYKVLLLADSTSRWAQALRETSGRMEEIPGEEAFPAYLDSAVKGLYERAGVIKTRHGTGSLTMIGTVSPAGGNFEEPVTQSTLGTVKTFLGLSYDRAYKRFYPAIDPLVSWSRYLEQLRPFFDKEVEYGWSNKVKRLLELLEKGDAINQMMQVTGEEGISIEDFAILQKAQLLDIAYLQQDAFDPVDVTVPLERQRAMLLLIERIVEKEFAFADKEKARETFTRLMGLFKNLNYAASSSQEYRTYLSQIEAML
ncbi:MAG: V-type ATP synthase subunit A [Pseudomonadota bacterium]|nr:V-type ATP synthase subunit A [Pseudomonadota bacterium]